MTFLGRAYLQNYFDRSLSITIMGLKSFAILFLKHWINVLRTRQNMLGGVTFHLLFVTRCDITCYLLQNLLVTRCRSCSLQKVTRYSLQKLLVTKIHELFVSKVARYSLQKLFAAKNHSSFVANSLVTLCKSYSLQNLLVTRCKSCSLENITRYSLQNSLVSRCRSFWLQKITRNSLQNSFVTR